MMVTVYIADGDVDHISDSDVDRATHAKDLRKLGCSVRVKHFDSWDAAQTWADEYEEKKYR